MYDFLTGPALWATFGVFILGCLIRVVLYIKGLSWQLDRVPYGYHNSYALKGAFKSIFHWLVPFATRNWRLRPGFTVLFFVFHVGLVITPLFLTAHVELFKAGIGLSWPTLPAGLADIMTIGVMVGALFLILRRIAFPEVRILTTLYDYLLIVISAAPFVTGFLARYQASNYDFWLIAHILTGEIMLIAIPFTKLSHFVLFFCSRAQIGIDFGIKRGGMKGRGVVW